MHAVLIHTAPARGRLCPGMDVARAPLEVPDLRASAASAAGW